MITLPLQSAYLVCSRLETSHIPVVQGTLDSKLSSGPLACCRESISCQEPHSSTHLDKQSEQHRFDSPKALYCCFRKQHN